MKNNLKIGLISVVIVLFLGGMFKLGERSNTKEQRKVNKLEKKYPIIAIGYEVDSLGQFNFIPPANHFIQIDTANHKIFVIDSAWVQPMETVEEKEGE